MILTGNMINAREAFARGLVNRVVPNEVYLLEAKKLAHEVALKSPLAVALAKEARFEIVRDKLNRRAGV